MRLGIISYTNFNSGIGLFGYELYKYLDGDSILSIGSVKGPQEVWSDRQLSTYRPPADPVMRDYFGRFLPEIVMFIETPFSANLFSMAHTYGAKTVAITMHETCMVTTASRADLVICPCYSAWEKSHTASKKLLFLPIGIELFPFRERTGHVFLMNIGYGGPQDRRQAETVIKAFCSLTDPNARMIVNSQVNFPGRIDDPRIEYRLQNFPEPKDCYADGDIYLSPTAYDGYGRPVLEAMACGLPCLTTDADPMNLFQHDHDFLVDPSGFERMTESWIEDTIYNRVSIEDVKKKMEWLLTIDTAKYSERARKQAEVQSWESAEPDYKAIWLQTLEELCSA